MKNAFFIEKCYEFVKEQLMKPSLLLLIQTPFYFPQF